MEKELLERYQLLRRDETSTYVRDILTREAFVNQTQAEITEFEKAIEILSKIK